MRLSSLLAAACCTVAAAPPALHVDFGSVTRLRGGAVELRTPQVAGDDDPATPDAATHSALARTVATFAAATITVRMRTESQTRTRGVPNAWERAWLGWDYRDERHFYYVLLKTNGWEVGKRDPSYPGGQRFLASGAAPAFPLRRWSTVVVRESGGSIAVDVDGRPLARLTDRSRPYTSGAVALYDEDSVALFDGLAVVPR